MNTQTNGAAAVLKEAREGIPLAAAATSSSSTSTPPTTSSSGAVQQQQPRTPPRKEGSDVNTHSNPRQQQQRRSVAHQSNVVQQDDSDDQEDESPSKHDSDFMNDSEGEITQVVTSSSAEDQKPKPTTTLVPSPPKSSRPAQNTNDDNNNVTSARLPPINNKKSSGKQNENNNAGKLGDRKKSIAFQKKVAKHQFRDDDKSKPGFKVDRKPKDLLPKDDENNNIKRKQSTVSLQQKVQKHQFRDDDKSKPNFVTDRHPKDLESDSTNNNNKPSNNEDRRKSVPVHVKVRKHNFHDFDTNTNNTNNKQPPNRKPSQRREKVRNYQEEALKRAHEAEAKKQAQGKVAPIVSTVEESEEQQQAKKQQNLKRKQSAMFGASMAMFSPLTNDHNNGDKSTTDHPDPTFPRQPRCDQYNLEVPVARITDLLWDKYSTAYNDHAEAFPVNKLSTVYAKIWPGHGINEEEDNNVIEMSYNAIIDDRNEEKKKTLPEDALTHKEFNLCHRTVAVLNNWYKQKVCDAEKTPKILDIEAFVVVADRAKIEKPAKVYMELTDNKGADLPLGKLAKFIAAQQKRGLSQSLMLSTKSFMKRNDNGDGKHDDENYNNNSDNDQQDEDDPNANKFMPKFPRQPKCDPDDLTLPTSRILTLMFNRYAAALPEEEPISQTKLFPISKLNGAINKIWPGNSVPKDYTEDAIDLLYELREEEKEKWSLQQRIQQVQKQKDEEKKKVQQDDEEEGEGNNNNNKDSSGNDDATAAAKQIKREESFLSKEPETVSKDGLAKKEFMLCFRIIANMCNWRRALNPDTPKLLELEDFAMACDRLKLEKPGKLFMEMTNMQQKAGVTQAELAYYFSKKKKTFRYATDNHTDHDDSEDDDDAAGGGGGGSRKASFSQSARRVSSMVKVVASNNNNNNKKSNNTARKSLDSLQFGASQTGGKILDSPGNSQPSTPQTKDIK